MTRKLPHKLQQRRREKCEGKGEKRRKEEGGKKKEREEKIKGREGVPGKEG